MRTNSLALALAGGLLLCIAAPAGAQPDPATPYLGTYELTGRYSNLRNTKAELKVERAADGTLSVTRTGRYTAKRFRNVPPFAWVSKEVKAEGGALKVTFRLTKEGLSLTLADGGSLVNTLTGDAPSGGGATVDPSTLNVLVAEYKLAGDELRENVENTTRKKPQDWWRRVATKGKKLSAPTPAAAPKRLKLGHDADVENGRFTIVLPTDGRLTLELAGATLRLEAPNGSVAALSSGSTLTFELGHASPAIGTYTCVVEGLSGSAKLKARFVQEGKIDARIRPWSSHTYYPISHYSWGENENQDTMFCKGGPLEKFDQALGLTGKQSALWWEKGTDYRTGFGFERGHYVKIHSPTEKNAEAEWFADMNGDGVIETEAAAGVVKRMDKNGDGKVARDEAQVVFLEGAVKSLFGTYDGSGDDKVGADEMSAAFITRYDRDGSKDLDYAEWKAALEKDYKSLIEGKAKANLDAFMGKDKDGDGFVVEAEVGAPGGVDFQDDGDADGDFESFFDRDNVRLTAKDGKSYVGNKVVEEGDKLKLFKGRKQDQLVVELAKADLKAREDGIADGDLDDSYSVGWWGHCNAWAMASIIFRKPAMDLSVNGVTLSVRDQKGVLVEFGMGDTEDATFWWQQWGEGDIPADKYAAGFHRHLHEWLRVNQQGLMADMDMKDPNNNLNFQVWNYPLIGYSAALKEAEGDDPYVLDVTNTLEKGSYSDDDSSGTSAVSYRLHFAVDGAIQEGEGSKTSWEQKSGEARVYIRYLIHPFRFSASRGSRNANVTLERLQKLFGERLKYNRLEDLAAESGLTPPGQ